MASAYSILALPTGSWSTAHRLALFTTAEFLLKQTYTPSLRTIGLQPPSLRIEKNNEALKVLHTSLEVNPIVSSFDIS